MAARNSRSSGYAQQLPSRLLIGMHAEPSFWASAGCRSGTAPSLEAVSGWHRISGAALVFRRSDGTVSSWSSDALGLICKNRASSPASAALPQTFCDQTGWRVKSLMPGLPLFSSGA